MIGFLDIAEQIIVDRIISNKVPVTGESKIKFFLIALSGLLGLAGLGFSFFALYLWLSTNYTAVVTAAGLGISMLVLSALFALSTYSLILYKRREMKRMRKDFIELTEKTLEIFEKELSKPVNDNPKTSVLISSVAGYLAGERFL